MKKFKTSNLIPTYDFLLIELASKITSDVIRADLYKTLSKRGFIPSLLVSKLLNDLNIDIESLMILLLPLAAEYARVPISNFKVGAVALGMPHSSSSNSPGNLYLGANIELTQQALSFSIHGEQSAINHAWIRGETGLQTLAVNYFPCGHCRQFLYELTTATKELRILVKTNKKPNELSYTTYSLSTLLPFPFGPHELDVKGGFMQPEFHKLTISGKSLTAKAALSGANTSYAPYTKNYSGVALKARNNIVYIGKYAENAAYNPSISPIQSALAFMNMNLPPQVPLEIIEAVLVETQSCISQKDTTKIVLSSVAPSIIIEYYKLST